MMSIDANAVIDELVLMHASQVKQIAMLKAQLAAVIAQRDAAMAQAVPPGAAAPEG